MKGVSNSARPCPPLTLAPDTLLRSDRGPGHSANGGSQVGVAAGRPPCDTSDQGQAGSSEYNLHSEDNAAWRRLSSLASHASWKDSAGDPEKAESLGMRGVAGAMAIDRTDTASSCRQSLGPRQLEPERQDAASARASGDAGLDESTLQRRASSGLTAHLSFRRWGWGDVGVRMCAIVWELIVGLCIYVFSSVRPFVSPCIPASLPPPLPSAERAQGSAGHWPALRPAQLEMQVGGTDRAAEQSDGNMAWARIPCCCMRAGGPGAGSDSSWQRIRWLGPGGNFAG